jgi:hypothetical protein
MTTRATASLLLAGLLAAGGAYAQNSATPTTDSATGEESTMTNGRPNAVTTNNPAIENPATAPSVMGAPAATVNAPPGAVVVLPSDSVVVVPAATVPAATVVVPAVPNHTPTGEGSNYGNSDDPVAR